MSIRVLVFESDPSFAAELSSELGRLGCATTIVDDGNVGLQSAASERPDLILLSIELPRMNGFSVCNKLKKDPSLKDVPLIIMSSESSDETFEQHRKLRTRAEDYVHKPVAFGELLQRIAPFVDLGAAAGDTLADGGDEIVIDDAIEIDDAETLDADALDEEPTGQHAVSAPGAHLSWKGKPVDDEVDHFADDAFDRMMEGDGLGEGPGHLQLTAPTPIHSGLANVAPTVMPSPALHGNPPPLPPPPRTAAPVAPPPPLHEPAHEPPHVPAFASSGAQVTVAAPPLHMGDDDAQVVELHVQNERVATELLEARAEAARLTAELASAQAEVERAAAAAAAAAQHDATAGAELTHLREEVEALRGQIAASAKGRGVSSREFLDLREALNKKDKEILALRDQISRTEKDLLDARDGALALVRERADQDDRVAALEKELSDARSLVESLKADKDQAAKRADDYKSRGDKTRAELEAKTAELATARQRHLEESAANASAHAAALASALEQAGAEAATALAGAVAAREAELRAEHDAQLAAAFQSHEEAQHKASAAHDAALAGAVEASDARLAERERELGAQIEAAKAAAATLERELAARTEERDAARARVERATAKWEADSASLQRAKDSLASALVRIEETEARALE